MIRFFLLVLLVVLSFPSNVSAHVLKIDGEVGATLHIDPADDPEALSQSGFFFEIKDRTNKFKASDCLCQVSIYEDGKELFSESILQPDNNSESSVSFYYTFPKKGVYKLELLGKPKNNNSFQQFKFDYDIRVDKQSLPAEAGKESKEASSNWIKAHTIHLVGGVAVLGFFIFALIKQRREGVK